MKSDLGKGTILSDKGLPASQFYMWRAIIAMVHADGIVTPQELAFVQENTKDLPFSQAQRQVLLSDFQTPRDVFTMFSQITSPKDRRDFFVLARALCWADGEYDRQEKNIMEVLEGFQIEKEDKALLEESRQVIQEIDLDKTQWDHLGKDKWRPAGVFKDFIQKVKSA